MSAIVVDSQVVHYEVIGRGQPVLFLHGWLGSWRYWFPTMDYIARQQHFRTYSFDFWGFGESLRQNTPESIQAYSDQVIRFIDELGIDRVMLVGHSMGGMVALKTALNHPDRIARMAVVGAPVSGDSLMTLLRIVDRPKVAELFVRVPWVRRIMFRRFLGDMKNLANHGQEVLLDTEKSTAQTLHRSVHSMVRTDLRLELPKLNVPTLVVHGGRDEIVPAKQADLYDRVKTAEVVLMPESRHFPFLDEADLFNDILLRFLRQEAPRAKLQRVSRRQPVPAQL